MDSMACSDPIVNNSITNIALSIKKLEHNQAWKFALVIFNLFIIPI